MVGMTNWKGFGRKQSCSNRDNIMSFAERTREHLKKASGGTVGVPTEIGTATS
jgi:hypothetical protein